MLQLLRQLRVIFDQKIRYQRGFSLTELMIVLAMIAMLSAIAIPAYRRYIIDTKFSEIFMIAQKYQREVDEAFTLTGTVPSNRTDVLNTSTVIQVEFSNNSNNAIEFMHIYLQNFYPGWRSNDALIFRGEYDASAKLVRWTCCQHPFRTLPSDVVPERCSTTCVGF